MTVSQKAEQIAVVILDVDGVLTDGRIGYSGASGGEIKFFDVKDGLGIKLLQRNGIRVGILSGRKSRANEVRAVELGLDFVYQGVGDKRAGLETLLAEQGTRAENCLYVGDDLVDLPVMRRVGMAVAVADAPDEVKARADMVTTAAGGRGAVRETAVWLLTQRGAWQTVVAGYLE
jgi:3-deoxy-D-manno-octulosonate 8-phosphate phosphatase (KDO 8-P phosphatase)